MSKLDDLLSENIMLKEKITELKSELLLLRIENVVDLEPIQFSLTIIDLYKESCGENYVDMLCELADYIETYCEHHQFNGECEYDGENDD